ncbi:MAG: phosphoglycolate phosphatase [Clostridiales bacterium]|jgi:phosphoglycolate phosphatase|nr:phosphoglycolate phosphatase [Clostridiales bacterium]MDK2934795.1 phosphoglycolate phosphatase [Clostridiales bacterium]
MIKYDVLLFDLDGTLTDPKIGITKSVQYALAKFNIIEDNLDKLEPFIGPPLTLSFQKYYGLSEEATWQAVKFYREYFSEVGMYENFVYPGIEDLLAKLKHQNRNLMVATSKPTVFAKKILEHFQLSHYFSSIVGSNLDGTRIEKAEVIGHALSQLDNLQKYNIVMIGDRKYDIIGSIQNKIDSIGVTYGYGSIHELQNANPTYLVDSVADLKLLLNV